MLTWHIVELANNKWCVLDEEDNPIITKNTKLSAIMHARRLATEEGVEPIFVTITQAMANEDDIDIVS